MDGIVGLDSDENPSQVRKYIGEVDVARFEYIITFSHTPEKERYLNSVRDRLLLVSATLEEAVSRDDDEIFLLVSASVDVMEEIATRVGILKKLKGEGRAVFNKTRAWMFENFTHSINYWSSYERNAIIWHLIQGRSNSGGANIDIGKMIELGQVNACFPLHNIPQRERLMQYWVRARWYALRQPIDMVKEYFGEYITLYFAWLEFYIRWLAVPSLLGIPFFIAGQATHIDNVGVPIYAIIIMVWATLFIEWWKRELSTLNYEWGTTTLVSLEKIRPSFSGTKRTGLYYKGEWVDLERTGDPVIDKDIPESDYVAPNERTVRFGAGVGVLTTFVGIAIVSAVTVFWVRQLNGKDHPTLIKFAPVGSFANAIIILVLNMVYRKIAVKLTDWENHRTDQSYESSFVVKCFLFQFVNSYFSLFYVAFIQENVPLPGTVEITDPPMKTLMVQLGTILGTNIVVGQLVEVAIPWFSGKVSIWLESYQLKKKKIDRSASQAEIENKQVTYQNTFDDFNEMAIQFGYVTLFAAAFPLAPLAALLNNLIEVRTDGFKLLMGLQRPHPRSANSIGIWLNILEFLSYMSVITNVGIIFFTSNIFDKSRKVLDTPIMMVLIAFLVEHIILGIKYSLQYIIPDVPGKVRSSLAKEEYMREMAEQRVIDEELSQDSKSELQ
eukprot:TRINITY_DN6970_c0_g1_i2.p1 TRINITY_DN6970_c0_g1~~TRINITY_DN6970_c0_g1_i2.p1  ORF type:complete len:691 (+),score=181.45 TRINITY_DN6970_c0_g1_i2:70-2073(+)